MLKEKNKYKKENGITLVALVITVVIMLILAGVAIAAVVDGDGLFSKTRQAAETHENATEKENDQIQTLMNEIDKYLTGTVNDNNEGINPEEVAIIGDFVNYSVEVDGVTYDKWRILDFDNNGHMEIVCYNGPSFTMGGKNDYANAIKLLNDESIPYGNGIYGYSTRHLGSDPSNPSRYETIDESYIKFYEDFDNIELNANYGYINQTHHKSDLEAIKSFSNAADGEGLAGGWTWLASRCATAYSSYRYFSVRLVGGFGNHNYRTLFSVNSDGSENGSSLSYDLAPVVILESGVKINTSTAGNGSEGSPWTLTK